MLILLMKFICMRQFHSTGSGMLGSWWFGGPSSPDSNYLRVANAFPNRRLSDNTLMTPKIRIAPSCASSPGKYEGWNLRQFNATISPFIWRFRFFAEHEILNNDTFRFLPFFYMTYTGGTPGGGLPIRRHSSIGPQGKCVGANWKVAVCALTDISPT